MLKGITQRKSSLPSEMEWWWKVVFGLWFVAWGYIMLLIIKNVMVGGC
jgi:hypothetical protein